MAVEVLGCVGASGGRWGRGLRLLVAAWLLVGLGTGHAQTQQVRVSGSVSEAGTRLPIPGATVQVQRTRRGVVTSTTGDFSIDVLATDTVLFRALGYKIQRLPLGGTGLSQLVVRIQLARDSVRLGEVQVTAQAHAVAGQLNAHYQLRKARTAQRQPLDFIAQGQIGRAHV